MYGPFFEHGKEPPDVNRRFHEKLVAADTSMEIRALEDLIKQAKQVVETVEMPIKEALINSVIPSSGAFTS